MDSITIKPSTMPSADLSLGNLDEDFDQSLFNI